MPIHTSHELNKLAQTKIDDGCRDAIAGMADRVDRSYTRYILPMYQRAEEQGYMRQGLVLTLVEADMSVFHFEGKTPDDVMTLIAAAQPKQIGKVAPRVMVKMAADRLQKLVHLVAFQNEMERKRWEYHRDAMLEAGKPAAAPPEPHVLPAEIRTIGAFRDALEEASAWNGWTIGKHARDVKKKFLCKQELTDDDISAGWDLVLAREVMKS